MTIIFVALGSNLDDPHKQIMAGIEKLRVLKESQLIGISRIWQSAPQGYLHQPDFCNGAVKIQTKLTAHEILKELQYIEKHHGRQRILVNGPRTLDLDLILYGDHVIQTPDLIVPHPRLAERLFVLRPLQDLQPNLIIPKLGSLNHLIEHCPPQTLFPLETKSHGYYSHRP